MFHNDDVKKKGRARLRKASVGRKMCLILQSLVKLHMGEKGGTTIDEREGRNRVHEWGPPRHLL